MAFSLSNAYLVYLSKKKKNFTFSAKRLGCYLIIFYCFQSDPMAVVYTKSKDGALEELGRTEVVLNSLNPMWFTKLIINYQFEVVQTLV